MLAVYKLNCISSCFSLLSQSAYQSAATATQFCKKSILKGSDYGVLHLEESKVQ
jgi:hypothetical protein